LSEFEADPRRAPILPVREPTGHRAVRRQVMVRLKRRFVIRRQTLRDFLRHRCIFVHVPKAAGISVLESLFGHRGGAHMTLREYRRAFEGILGVPDFDDYFKCAFVRNPWDRCHSAFHFLRRGGMLPQDVAFGERHLARFQDFREFVREWLVPENLYLAPHFAPQSWFLIDESGELGLDFIGRLERISEDYETLRRRLGFGTPLARLNVSEGRSGYLDAYDDETRELVGRVYAEDVERLGYTFEGCQATAEAPTSNPTDP